MSFHWKAGWAKPLQRTWFSCLSVKSLLTQRRTDHWGGAGFPSQLCSAHWSPQADIADGLLCLRLSQQSLPSKNIQGGTTWLLISGDENISGPQMTDCWWSIDRIDLEQRCLSRSQRICNINCFYILGFVFFSFGFFFCLFFQYIVSRAKKENWDTGYSRLKKVWMGIWGQGGITAMLSCCQWIGKMLILLT